MKFSLVACAVVCSTLASGCEILELLDIGPGGGGGNDGPWINVYSHQVTDGEPQNIGNSCSIIDSGNGTTTSGSNDENGYWIEEETNDEGLSVRMHVGDEVTEEHRYDRAFFESGELDRFILTAPTGEEFSYSVWGANECQDCPSEPYEPLPGDLFCGGSSVSEADGGASGEADGYVEE